MSDAGSKRRTQPFSLWAIAALVLGVAVGAVVLRSAFVGELPSEPRSVPRPNVILITVDTLRADHLGAYGYGRATSPNLDAIATESLLYENAYVPRGLTWPSMAALATGLYPASTGIRRNGQHLDEQIPTLMKVLEAHGYVTAGFFANACELMAGHFQHLKCGADEEMTAAALDWLQERSAAPFLLWFHLFSPHKPYSPPGEFDLFTPQGYVGELSRPKGLDAAMRAGRSFTRQEIEYVVGLYDGEVRHADSLIGELWSGLAGMDLLDRSIVVLSSDHGEDLAQYHDYFYHACSVHEASLRVPLMIRLPDGAHGGEVATNPVGNVGVTPTVLKLLGLDPPEMDGRPLLDDLHSTKKSPALSEWRHDSPHTVVTLRFDDFRYIYNPTGEPTVCAPKGFTYPVATEALYDLTHDPGETRNVLDEHPETARRLRALAEQLNWDAGTAALTADEQTLERLEALGYLVE
jgi:arylsulfatase A-like enzyme